MLEKSVMNNTSNNQTYPDRILAGKTIEEAEGIMWMFYLTINSVFHRPHIERSHKKKRKLAHIATQYSFIT